MLQHQENNTYKFNEETKAPQILSKPKEFTRDRPFKYSTNSECDDYDSEQDEHEFQQNKNLKVDTNKEDSLKIHKSVQEDKNSK